MLQASGGETFWPVQFGFLAKLPAIFGGNITLYTELCERARSDAYRLMLEHAAEAGANAVIGATGEGVVPWTLIPNVPPKKGEYALSTEAFCGVVAETSLEAADEGAFIDAAASGRMRWIICAACALAAVPSRTRPAMPCKMQARRKAL